MKVPSAIAALLLILGFCIPGLCQSTDATAPYEITIQALQTGSSFATTDEPEVMSGFEVALKVTLTNLSDHKLLCCGGGGESYVYYVRDSGGHPLKRKEYPVSCCSGGGSGTLAPGRTWTGVTGLIDFNMTRPDTYTVQLGWPGNPMPGQEEVVKSNIVKVTITERKPFMLRISGYADGKAAGEHTSVKTGANIGINIQKENISKQEIDCSSADNRFTGLDDKYQYDIRDGYGNIVAQRALTGEGDPYIPGADRTTPCKPGESGGSNSVNLTTAYELTRPDTYTIRISQQVSNYPADGEVRSNKFTITVTP